MRPGRLPPLAKSRCEAILRVRFRFLRSFAIAPPAWASAVRLLIAVECTNRVVEKRSLAAAVQLGGNESFVSGCAPQVNRLRIPAEIIMIGESSPALRRFPENVQFDLPGEILWCALNRLELYVFNRARLFLSLSCSFPSYSSFNTASISARSALVSSVALVKFSSPMRSSSMS